MEKRIFTHFSDGDYIKERFEIAKKMTMGLGKSYVSYLKGELAIIIIIFPTKYQHYPYMTNYAETIVQEEEKETPFIQKHLYVIGIERILLLEINSNTIPTMSYVGIRRSTELNTP